MSRGSSNSAQFRIGQRALLRPASKRRAREWNQAEPLEARVMLSGGIAPSSGEVAEPAESDVQMNAVASAPEADSTTSSVGSSASFTNVQPLATINYIIALQGIFPSRTGVPDAPNATEGSIGLIGEVRPWASNFAPAGWAFTDGQLLPIAQFSALFSILGTTYGGDGRTTFALPDLRGRVPIHPGNGISLGEKGGGETTVLAENNMPAHQHTLLSNGVTTTAFGGSNQPVDNRQPYLGINHIIATQGIFPTEDENPFLADVILFAGNFAPRGYQLTNGQTLSIASNTALFSLLGTTYGGNGVSTFQLPDLRGRAAIQQGNGPGLSPVSLGQTFGVANLTLSEADFPQHTHETGTPNGTPNTTAWGVSSPSALENRMPSLGLNWIIPLVGTFPSPSASEDASPMLAQMSLFAGNFAPAGWALAQGQVLSIASNQALFSLLGTIYGGDGRSTFALPDLRGRVAIGEGTGPGLPFRSLGSKTGVETVTLTQSNLPTHAHTFTSSDPPVISGLTGLQAYKEDRSPLILSPNAAVADPDSTTFDGGTLTATLTNAETGDQLTVVDFRDVTVTGNDVRNNGTLVATMAGSTPAALAITFNTAAMLGDLTAVLNAVAYSNTLDNPVGGIRDVEFVLTDGAGGSSSLMTQQVDMQPQPDRPQIANLGGPVTFIEDAGPIDLTSTGTLFDPDLHPDWNGARLNVQVSRNLDSFDRLTIRNDGMGAGQIGVVGSDVFYEGTQIGTFNGGVGTTRLQINFIAGSTTASIQALINAIQFENLIDLPVVASKDIRFELTDPENFANVVIPNGIMIVNIQAANDLPAIAGISATPVTYNEGAAPRTVGTGGTITDADYNGSGFLRVSIVVGGEASDRLGILNQGMGTNQVGISGNQVFFSGTLIGTHSGGIGTNPLQVNLNANATRTGAQSVMRLVQYSSVSEDPSTMQRQLDFLFNDGDGADSNVLSAFVNVNATNDPSVIANFGAGVNTTTNTSVRVANLVTITDVDSPDFAGGFFRATISSGQQAGDSLSLLNDATISVVGSNVFYLGTNIGTLSTNATSLTVLLNVNATATMVQRLGRNLEFSATATGTRAIRYQVLDGDGGNTTGPDKNINVT